MRRPVTRQADPPLKLTTPPPVRVPDVPSAPRNAGPGVPTKLMLPMFVRVLLAAMFAVPLDSTVRFPRLVIDCSVPTPAAIEMDPVPTDEKVPSVTVRSAMRTFDPLP